MSQALRIGDTRSCDQQPVHCGCRSETQLHELLRYVKQAAPWHRPSIICIGDATSRVVDELLAHGYLDLTVVDRSASALQAAQLRLGTLAKYVAWLETDVLGAALSRASFQIWHDAVVYRSLDTPADRARYVTQMSRALKPSGFGIVATFKADKDRSRELDSVRIADRGEGVWFRRIETRVLEPEGSLDCSRQLAYGLWRRELMPTRRTDRTIAA